MHLPAQRQAEGGACQRILWHRLAQLNPPPVDTRTHTQCGQTRTVVMHVSVTGPIARVSVRPRKTRIRLCVCVCACDTECGKHTGRIVVPALRARCYPYRRRCIAQARTDAYSGYACLRIPCILPPDRRHTPRLLSTVPDHSHQCGSRRPCCPRIQCRVSRHPG